MRDAGDDPPHARELFIAVQLVFQQTVPVHALGQHPLGAVDEHEQRPNRTTEDKRHITTMMP